MPTVSAVTTMTASPAATVRSTMSSVTVMTTAAPAVTVTVAVAAVGRVSEDRRCAVSRLANRSFVNRSVRRAVRVVGIAVAAVPAVAVVAITEVTAVSAVAVVSVMSVATMTAVAPMMAVSPMAAVSPVSAVSAAGKGFGCRNGHRERHSRKHHGRNGDLREFGKHDSLQGLLADMFLRFPRSCLCPGPRVFNTLPSGLAGDLLRRSRNRLEFEFGNLTEEARSVWAAAGLRTLAIYIGCCGSAGPICDSYCATETYGDLWVPCGTQRNQGCAFQFPCNTLPATALGEIKD
jgi:hypothetical protein